MPPVRSAPAPKILLNALRKNKDQVEFQYIAGATRAAASGARGGVWLLDVQCRGGSPAQQCQRETGAATPARDMVEIGTD